MSPRTRSLAPLLIVLGLGFAAPAPAERDADGLEELIPHAESDLEKERLRAEGRQPTDPRARGVDPPPLAPIRNCGEWEPLTGVLVRYPLGLPYTLLRDLDDVVTLHVVVSSGNQNNAIANFVANGIDTSAVQLLVRANNSIWTRDYGPWFVFDGAGDLGIVDHTYNRPFRPDDNLIPVYFGQQQGIPVYSHGMWHTGGNYMTDGAQISMSTDLVYNEAHSANGMSETEVDALMNEYYGVVTYNVVDDIEAGGIHHIDTWGKFLDEETVLIKEVWPNHYTYGTLEARATLIGSLLASTGRPYQVFRVYCHNIGNNKPASYTNSLLVNDRICVPTFNSSANDNAALDAYREASPGSDVRGYYYGGWLTDDALHCRGKGVMDRGMLRVAHVPVSGEQQAPVPITAFVDDRSETGILAVELWYRFEGEGWQTTPMSNTGGDNWSADLPSPARDTLVDYYVLASDNSGRVEGKPRVAPNHWYTFPILAGATGAPVTAAPDAPRTYPNPFRDRTHFRFELKFPAPAELAVYDVRGRLVRELLSGTRPAGTTEVEWDARDQHGRKVPAGVYYFRLRAVGLQHTRPVVLTK